MGDRYSEVDAVLPADPVAPSRRQADHSPVAAIGVDRAFGDRIKALVPVARPIE